MSAVIRWVTGRKDAAPRTRSTQTVHRNTNDGQLHLPRATNPDTVIYASRDPRRDVQFVCHLPEGSQLAEQAQKIAGAVYSGRPVQPSSNSTRLLTSSREYVTITEGSKPRQAQHAQELSDPNEFDAASADGFEQYRDTHRHVEATRASSRPAWNPSVDDTRSASTASGRHATKNNSPPGGLKIQSETHVAYNIKDGKSGRHLFVSAPIGSKEAAVHDQVVAMGARRASDKALTSDGQRGISRSSVDR